MEFRKLSKLHKYAAAISFLAMEIFALIAFSFGDNYILYGALSVALMVLLVLFNIKQISVDGISSIAFFIFPLFLYTLLTALGIYSRAHMFWGDFSLGEVIFIPLGLIPVAFTGYLLSIDKTFNIKTFLIVIYGALALISVINLICNFVNFGAFYTVLYKGYRMYYAGEASSVTVDKFAYVLQGLKFVEVKMSQYVIYPALLLTSSIALLFVSPKEHKKTFITYAGFTLIGLLSLIFIPSMLGLYAIIIILVVDLCILLLNRYGKAYKYVKYFIYFILIMMAIGLLIFILAHQTKYNISNKILSNNLLGKIFGSNRFTKDYVPAVTDIFFDNFLGSYTLYPTLDPVPPIELSNSFIFDNIVTSGVIGALCFVIMLFVGFKGFKRYIFNSKDDKYAKLVLLAFTIFFTVFSAFFMDREIGIFYNIIRPIYMTGPFFLVLFIFTYVIAKGKASIIKENPQVEEVSVNA